MCLHFRLANFSPKDFLSKANSKSSKDEKNMLWKTEKNFAKTRFKIIKELA